MEGKITTEYDGEVYIKAIYDEIKDSVKLIVKPDFNNWKAFFEPIPNAFPDLNSYYKETSGNSFSVVLTKVDINKDGRTDLVFHLWHMRHPDENLTVPFDAPVPNRLVALVSQPNGTLKDKTSEIFGDSIVDLAGGKSSDVAIADINLDGYPDWIYSMEREDGRPMAFDNWNTRQVAVLSKGNGSYQTIIFGDKQGCYSVNSFPMYDGSFHVKLGGDQEYLFSNDTFTKADFAPVDCEAKLVYSSENKTIPNYLLGFSYKDSPNQYKLFKRTDSQNWMEESVFKWQDYRSIYLTDNVSDPYKTTVILYNGKEYISPFLVKAVALKLYPNSIPTPIIYIGTSYLTKGTQGRTTIHRDETIGLTKLMAFESKNGLLQEINILSDPESLDGLNSMEEIDLNKDGYEDLITYPYIDGAKPKVFLNNQNGKLILLNQNRFPDISVKYNYTSAFADVDGDGIEDLIIWPGNGCFCDNPCTTFFLYKGRRQLK